MQVYTSNTSQRAVSDKINQSHQNSGNCSTFKDLRPASISQRKIQQFANDSDRVSAGAIVHQMANHNALQRKCAKCDGEAQLKSSQPIQRATVSNNCTAPNIGSHLALGNSIHTIIEQDYLTYGYAGGGNTRQVEQAVPTGHQPDLAVRNGGGAISRYGEIKPATQVAAGRNQITGLAGDGTNPLALGDQLNLAAWAGGFAYPLQNLDPGAAAVNITLAQDGTRQGLYLYDC